MRAVQVENLDGPDEVRLRDIDAPQPDGDQVVIDVTVAGVAFPDLLVTRGQYQMQPDLPFTPGAEIAGTVRSAPDGSGFAAGDRVAAFPGFGAFAETVAVPTPFVLPIPDGMSDEVAASLPMNYLTSLFALAHRGQLQAGETVLVHGAAGGIGTASIQVAKGLGARVIAVASSQQKREVALAAGADEAIGVEGFKDAARQLTDGRGVNVVVDPVGGDRFTDSLRSLAIEGRALVIGFTAGSIPEVKVNRLLLNNISVVGVGWGAHWTVFPEIMRQQWNQLLDLWRDGHIDPVLGGTFPLEEVVTALHTLYDRGAIGKLLLTVAG